MSNFKKNGFTLIELMVAIAIIGIIASVAYPSYVDSVRKTKRSDARVTLTQMAATQERLFTENNSYSNNLSDLGGATSQDGYYNISIANTGCSQAVGGKTLYSCFEITATATGTQSDDADCKTFTLDHLGVEASENDGGTASDCW